MIERRELLKLGAVTPIALGFPAALRAATGAVDLWVGDDRYALAAPDNQPAAALPGGDVTALWTGTLDAAWRKRGFVVAGLTGADALFVLEQLSWQHGRRVVERAVMAPASKLRPALVRWIIAPTHTSVTA